MSKPNRAEICVVACAEVFVGDGEIMASPMGLIPTIGARLARATFEPDLLLTDGVATAIADLRPVGAEGAQPAPVIEGWVPFRRVFEMLWLGRRHVMMGASQIDRYGNQNISCVGDWNQPKVQLLGVRGAPGNTINHTTSYWVPRHSPRVFVEQVDVVCGIGYDRARALGAQAARFHEIRRVVSNLGVFDFDNEQGRMQVRSRHPGVELAEICDQTGFELIVPEHVPETRLPTAAELDLLRNVIDPRGLSAGEVPP